MKNVVCYSAGGEIADWIYICNFEQGAANVGINKDSGGISFLFTSFFGKYMCSKTNPRSKRSREVRTYLRQWATRIVLSSRQTCREVFAQPSRCCAQFRNCLKQTAFQFYFINSRRQHLELQFNCVHFQFSRLASDLRLKQGQTGTTSGCLLYRVWWQPLQQLASKLTRWYRACSLVSCLGWPIVTSAMAI